MKKKKAVNYPGKKKSVNYPGKDHSIYSIWQISEYNYFKQSFKQFYAWICYEDLQQSVSLTKLDDVDLLYLWSLKYITQTETIDTKRYKDSQ